MYGVMPHTVPSARSLGEPVTSQLTPPSGATFVSVIMPHDNQKVVLQSKAGYGFIAPASELFSKNKTGKQIIRSEGGMAAPVVINEVAKQQILIVTDQGRALLFPLKDLPEMTKGKGNKMIQIDKTDLQSGKDGVLSMLILETNEGIVVHSGNRTKVLSAKDLTYYEGARGHRGKLLPRGFQQPTQIVVDKK
jgi:topoisomerase-4 subunit A